MQNNLVLDFDGTLVIENSTRVLERIVFNSYVGKMPDAINWIFFGAGSFYISALSSILGRVSRRHIDWRFLIFLRIVGGHTSQRIDSMFDDAASRLTLNARLLEDFASNDRIMIISCGLAPMIDSFVRRSLIDAVLLKGSKFTERSSGKISVELLEPRDKISVLLGIPTLEYVTDDTREAQLVAKNLKRSNGLSAHVSEAGGIYRVTST